MSRLRPGDERLHYCDGSHRWIPPDPDYPQEVWDELVRQHKELHLRTRDGHPEPGGSDGRWALTRTANRPDS